MKKGQKSPNAGVPRITNTVRDMTPAKREEWFAEVTKDLGKEKTAIVRARLDLLNQGKLPSSKQGQGQGRKVDFDKAFSRATAADLLALRPKLEAAIEAKRAAAMKEIEQAEADLAAKKAALQQ